MKPTGTGPVAEAKKRLSTLVSSHGTSSKPTPKAAGTSAPTSSSKEVEELKAKLEDSEARVEELKAEIATSQEKLLELSHQMQDEAQRVTEAEEQIRTQHHEMIEKLHATHKADVDYLKSQLEKDASEHAAELTSAKEAHDNAIAAKQAQVDGLKGQLEGCTNRDQGFA